MFARRTSWPQQPSRWARAVERARREYPDLIDLTPSNPTRAGLAYPAALDAALGSTGVGVYEPHPLGLASARQAVSALYARRGVPVDPERVALVASTSEAYALAFRLLCDPGAGVAHPRPGYPLIEWLARVCDVEPIPWRLERVGRRWVYDVEALDALPSTVRAVVAVAPNNPTGSWLDPHALRKLAHRCAERGIALIVDEVFADYPHGNTPLHVAPPEVGLTLCLDGLSKSRGLPQLKVGWVRFHGEPATVRQAMERWEVLADHFLSVSTPVQRALDALIDEGTPVREAIARRVEANARVLAQRCAPGMLVEAAEVDAGWYGVVRLPRVLDDESWAIALLEGARVVVHPGFLYDFDEEGMSVVSLLTPPGDFARGLERLVEFVESYTMTSSI